MKREKKQSNESSDSQTHNLLVQLMQLFFFLLNALFQARLNIFLLFNNSLGCVVVSLTPNIKKKK